MHGLAGFFLAQIIACKQVIVRYRIVRFVCSRYRWISYRSVRSCNLSLDIVSLVSRVQDYRRLLSRSCWDLWTSCRAVSLIREISANVVRRSTNGANSEEAQLWGISHKGRFSLGCPEAPEATIPVQYQQPWLVENWHLCQIDRKFCKQNPQNQNNESHVNIPQHANSAHGHMWSRTWDFGRHQKCNISSSQQLSLQTISPKINNMLGADCVGIYFRRKWPPHITYADICVSYF